MTREQWKVLDRCARALGRKFEPAINEYATNLLIYGAAGFRVLHNGEIRAATLDELIS